MKSKMFDLVLVAVVVISGSFIGYRLLLKKEPVTSSAANVAAPERLEKNDVSGFIRPDIPTNLPFGVSQRMVLKIKPQTEEDWKKAVAEGQGARYLVEQTDVCKSPIAPILYGYTILVPAVANQISEGKIKVLNDSLGRTCIKRGAFLPLVRFSFVPSEPAMKVIGNITIAEILQVPYTEMTEPLAQAFGMTLKEFQDFNSGPVIFGTRKISLLRFNKLEEPIVDKSKPTHAFPRTPLIIPTALPAWLAAHPRAIVVDVRSKDESTRLPLNFKGNIIQVPYVTIDGKPAFRWDKTVNEIYSDKQDIEPILNATKNQDANPVELLVVGSSPEDGRAPWTLFNILTLKLDRIFWYYEGAASFNQSLETGPAGAR